MPKVWKIAPGKGASHWDLCHKNKCILLGWRELPDYSAYDGEKQVLRALEKKCGQGAKGSGRGAAEMIWQFFDKVKEGDIIVANKGYRGIVGIGVVKSGYIPPGTEGHPSPDEWLPHARRVKWVVTKPVTMRVRFFVQRTLAPLSLDCCDEIRAKYSKKHPDLNGTLDKLFENLTEHTVGPEAIDIEPPAKVDVTVTRIVRDTAMAKSVKRLHKHRCQICRKTIELADGSSYAEAHHIRPLGGEHEGPDIRSNILCVCPNHHAELDFGARRIKLSQLYSAKGHEVGPEYINYHNTQVYRG